MNCRTAKDCLVVAALALSVWPASACRADQTAATVPVPPCGSDVAGPPLRERLNPGLSGPDWAAHIAQLTSDHDTEFGAEDQDQVNVTRAVGYSLLLPGAGQWYVGAKARAGAFLVGEALSWTLFGYFRTVSGIKEDDYRTYARLHAGIDPAGKSDDFMRLLTFYESRDQYNENGRLLDPARPFYPDNPTWNWQWDAPSAMQHYRRLRNQSNEATNRAKFALGAALVNRVISAVDAWRTAKSVNRRARMEASHWKLHLRGRPSLNHPAVRLVLSRQF